jgi:putative redox protein
MITIQSQYLGELRTQAEHLQSHTQIITDAPLDNQGKGEAFSPTDLVAGALGSCMMTIMGIYARREEIDLQGTTFEITKVMASNPRRISEVIIHFQFPEQLQTLSEKHKSALKHAALTCPVAQSLHPDLKQTVSFSF